MKMTMILMIAFLALAACAGRQADRNVPTLDGSSREALQTSLKAMTAGMTPYERQDIQIMLSLMIGSMICDPDNPSQTEREKANAIDDALEELDGMTLEDIRAWEFDDAARERAAACGSWH